MRLQFEGLSHGLKIARQLSIFAPVCALGHLPLTGEGMAAATIQLPFKSEFNHTVRIMSKGVVSLSTDKQKNMRHREPVRRLVWRSVLCVP